MLLLLLLLLLQYSGRYEAIESSGMSFRDRTSMGLAEGDEFYQLDDGGMVSVDFTETYYVGIIDILTEFNGNKKVRVPHSKLLAGGVHTHTATLSEKDTCISGRR